MRHLVPIVALIALAALGCRERPAARIGPGTVLTAHNEQGATMTLRIDAVEKDARDPDGEIVLYTASFRDPEDGGWKPYCLPDREGKTQAIALEGSWDAQRNHVPAKGVITLACTNGALAKCVRFGYKPWKKVFGISLADYHHACVHMVPADYCGDGKPHTRDGTAIDVYDRLGIQKKETAPGQVFEAAWSPTGAAYVAKTRWGGEPVEEIVSQCPGRLRGRTPEGGAPLEPGKVMDRFPEALIFTESVPTTERP